MEPFKEVFHRKAISAMGRVFARHSNHFDEKRFVALAAKNLDALELKQRSEQIYRALVTMLPDDFPTAARIILASLHPACDANAQKLGVTDDGVQGWMIMPLAEFAGRQGIDHIPIALDLLKELTMRFTSEFGIRHLWLARPHDVLPIVTSWTKHENEHVRRLVSEGSRPRLPWGMQLPAFIVDPKTTLPLLTALRDDPSPYVRRSVANHLNDIAKDHPAVVLNIAIKWHRRAPIERQRLLRHALRNLLKQGHSAALALYELLPPKLAKATLTISQTEVPLGGELAFTLDLRALELSPQRLRLDIVMHYQKANGRLAPKVFRWKDITLAPGENHSATRKQSFRPITTRVYHLGLHRVEIKANGSVIAGADFTLV